MKNRVAWGLAVLGTVGLGGCAEELPPPARLIQTTTNSIGIGLVYVPAGSFLMGNPHAIAKPVHRVSVDGFWLGQCEVTNTQFDRFKKRPRSPKSLTDRQPAIAVSWYEAVAFCQW